MISLIKSICRILPSYISQSRNSSICLYRWLFRSNHAKLYRPLICILPCGAVIRPENIQTEINQYDVEENIAHLMTLARIALEKGDIERAEAILEMGIKISEEYQSYVTMPYMYDILAAISFATGNLQKAELLLVKVIEKMVQLGLPDNDTQMIDFKLRLARIYSAYNEKELAEIGFKNCLTEQRNKISQGDTSTRTGMLYVNVMFWYGLHKSKNAEYTQARELIHSAYNYSAKIKGLSPYQELVILFTLGDLNTQLEDYDTALENLQSAIVLGKGIGSLDLPKCYLKMGKIYMLLGARDTAQNWLNEASKLAELFNDREVVEESASFLNQLQKNKSLFGKCKLI